MKAIITVGVSASGKTTWAKEYAMKNKAIISNRDDLRFSLTGASGWGEYKFDKKMEELISYIQMETVIKAFHMGKDVVIADTNLNPTIRDKWAMTCENLGYEVEIKPFPITLEEAWKRDTLRANGVGRDVIYKQWQQWNVFIGRKTYSPDESLPKAVIFDIDGTLAHMNGRGPFDWDKVDTDTVDPILKRIFQSWASDELIVISGREDFCAVKTLKWLYDNGMPPDALFMRKGGDNRKDTIIKEEIFWEHIAPNYNVLAVFDDRPSVVRMWHDIKIPKVIAVGNQCIEF